MIESYESPGMTGNYSCRYTLVLHTGGLCFLLNQYIHTPSPLVCFRQPTGKHCEPQYVHTSSPIWFCLLPRPMCSARGPSLLLHQRISRRQLCWERDLQVIIMLNKDMDPSKTVQIPQSLDAVTFHEVVPGRLWIVWLS